ncbi:MAG: isocitrate/isopropylmalate dehydrogenase family protein [Tissierellia bacterium]|nr:isocitrate/isopropylmalate dehydrogenase family protein [Tissierellia bacterium]
MKTITVIIGDGISLEVSNAAMEVIKATGVNIGFDIKRAGPEILKNTGSLVEEGLYESLERNKVALKGPISTPIGYGFSSINVELRKKYNLYANIRPVKTMGGFSKYQDVDLVIFRENTEDLYAGVEKKISDDEMHSIKIITRGASERIAQAAFEYAVSSKRRKVSVVTKANIMKLTDGLFLEVARETSKKFKEIEFEEILVDNMCMQLVIDPSRYDIILTENLYGDILSDLCAGLVGGLGLLASANIGSDMAIFEAVHGTAPDIAGRNIANPTALILSAAILLDHIGCQSEGNSIRVAVEKTLANHENLTRDLMGNKGTNEFTEIVISNLK